ncbi:ABC transporter permease subunit [Williamsia herbipolensis]|uniref:ABC transporter permease subunit n=1 Tax=Williamsia herbipolensis TaxID=1603258 RepID=A0AAU4JZ07_9NOCA|nr:ABC transporter permease subunit [Williamsia herbipolensis]
MTLTSPRPALRATDRRTGYADTIVILGAVVLLWLIVRLAWGATVPFDPRNAPTTISTDPADLPYYAARSLLRMFIALGASVLFTFVFAAAAARLPRARRVLLPALDILQSVPILGFLSITITGFIALFPGSEWGLESASIFAIFTSQAWNMAFAFYYSLVSQPRDLDEVSRNLRLSRWQRFWRVDVPSGMIPLVWNGMMSFGGGWFFLVASEALSVNNHDYILPGIGAYVATATAQSDLGRVALAIVAMIIMVVGVNIVFWRPLTAWAEKFRTEDTAAVTPVRSSVLTALRRSRIPGWVGGRLRPVFDGADRVMSVFGLAEYSLIRRPGRHRAENVVLVVIGTVAVAYGAMRVGLFIDHTAGWGQVVHCIALGGLTFGRVVVLLIVSTVVWVPIGVWIGLNPRISRLAAPVIQVLASFPANFLFPIATAVLVATGITLNSGGIVLMALGAQWYILFNVIAGASAIPTDLLEASRNLGLGRWLRWRRVILPGIFPSYVTGGITAAGGAWNASIVAEVVSYGSITLTASGLGAYIKQATGDGDGARILIGVLVMSAYVVGVNRIFWRPLYSLAQRRYSPA